MPQRPLSEGDADIVVLDQRVPEVAARIVALQRAAYAVEARLIEFDGIPPLHEAVAAVQALALTILAVCEHGELSAMLGYRRAGTCVEIDRLAVHPERFRRGLARRLIEAMHAREADAWRFEVSTGRDNTPAVTLYQQLGYRRLDDLALPQGVVITRFVREL